MIEKQVKISEIKRNHANPRVIRDEKYTKLMNSLLVFPKMLQARPIVVDKQMVVLGGNMRLKALQEIATFDNDELFARLQKINEWKIRFLSTAKILCQWLDFYLYNVESIK
ncbi:MAG: ParB N-terminal domain-containing protein [Methanobrevibacter sp.]|nr:ParB N-terminal domain-containing protein [Methanobrevibacter sp.]